jgi:GH24 family phage-related lysozyme (muramidase)
MIVGGEGAALVRKFEGCAKLRPDGKYDAYPDPGTGGEPWAIGWGHTGPGVRKGVIWTRAECDAALARDLGLRAAEVTAALNGAPTTQAQFDALVAFHYNTGAIARATLTHYHREGDYAAAAEEFGKWVHAGHRVLPGLVARRAAEAALYRQGSGL